MITEQTKRVGGRFASSDPKPDQFIELGENIIADLKDLEKMENFDGQLNVLHSKLTQQELTLIQRLQQSLREQNKVLERCKKHLRAAGIVLVEEGGEF